RSTLLPYTTLFRSQRHVGVRCLILLPLGVEVFLGSGEERGVGAYRNRSQRPPRRPRPHVEPARTLLVRVGEEVVAIVHAPRREELHLPAEERLDLLPRPPYGGGGTDHLGWRRLASRALAEEVDRRLV